jgi:hypothetical protein
MAIVTLVFVGLVMGLVFGLALEKSRVFEPGVIVGQMQLKNFTMLKVFLTSVAAGLVFLAVLHGVGAIELGPKATQLVSNVVGGLILGSGLVLAGACPGTSLAQIGAGYKDAWYILGGGLLGALFYGYIKASVIDPLLAVGDFGKVRLDQLTDVPFWILALIFAGIIVALLYWLEQRFPWNAQLGEDYEGLSPEARKAA